MKALSKIREEVSYKTKEKLFSTGYSLAVQKIPTKSQRPKDQPLSQILANGILDQYFSISKLFFL